MKPGEALKNTDGFPALRLRRADVVIKSITNDEGFFRFALRLGQSCRKDLRIGLGEAKLGGRKDEREVVSDTPAHVSAFSTFGLVRDNTEFELLR